MRITLNLATRPYADIGPAIKRLRVSMAVLAGLCVLLLIGLHLLDRRAEAARAREQSVDFQIGRVQAERHRAEEFMQMPNNAQLLDQTEVLNQLFTDKSFSWTLAMESLETVLPAGVQVTAIEPTRDKAGRITVHLHVVGPHDKGVDLVRNLEHSHRFLEPRIVGEAVETGTGNNQHPEPVSATNRFSFDLQAEYNPPLPGERFSATPVERASAQAQRAPENRGAQNQQQAPGANPHHFQEIPAFPQHVGRQPYTGPAQPGTNPSSRTPGGPQ
jgi:type IV pilus assembly protein PilN